MLSTGRAITLAISLAAAGPVAAITFLDTADTQHNTSTPGDNSGWQFEGSFLAFLGVPIGPYHFITAAHIGGTVGNVMDFHGDPYTTIAKHQLPGTDLCVWEVDHAKPFPIYAPLSSGVNDIGATATSIGRGKQRGAEVLLGGVLKGWNSGTADQIPRWGRNIIAREENTSLGKMLVCDFNNPGIADECHLSVGDSGGGLWVLENGLWRLAGIHYSVDGEFRVPPAGPAMRDAAIFDAGGLETGRDPTWSLIPDTAADNPASTYSSRISVHTTDILTITGGDGELPPEEFSSWLRLYFTPAQVADPAVSGRLADPDGDGISNLLEFALNLEPGFNAPTAMVASSGLSGLPLVSLENLAGGGRLTVEYVRRTSASAAGLTYVAEFSSALDDWNGGGVETVTAINSRWERVKVVDPVATTWDRRFARLRVTAID